MGASAKVRVIVIVPSVRNPFNPLKDGRECQGARDRHRSIRSESVQSVERLL
jgi:hypothetical protein